MQKPIFKKWWFWLIVVVILIGIIGSIGGNDTNNSTEDGVTEEATTQASVEAAPDLKEEFKEKFTTGSFLFSSSVRNDKTGKWRIATYNGSNQIKDYAKEYYEAYFESDDEIHFIVNLGLKTTSKITVIGDKLDVSVYEYVDGEEHDATLLASGMLLKQYQVNLSDGSIEEIQ